MIRNYNLVCTDSSYSSLSTDSEEGNKLGGTNHDISRPPILPIGKSLKTLHLPPSIESIDNLPCGLWNWIHSQDFVKQESVNDLTSFQGSGTKVIFNTEKIVNGKLVRNKHVIMDNHENASIFEVIGKNVKPKNNPYKCPLPRPLSAKRRSYLDSSQSLRVSELSLSRGLFSNKSSSFLSNSLFSVATKVDEPTTTSSIYIQAVELQGKFSSKFSAIVCEVEVGKRKFRTDPIKIEKHSNSVDIREGFLFNVPAANFTALVKVYGIHKTGKSVFSALTKKFNKRASLIRRSNDTLINSMEFNQTTDSNGGTEIYLGEVSFQLTNIKFSKLTGSYPLLISSSSSIASNNTSSSKFLKNRKKNDPNKVPRIVIQMGIYNEEPTKIDAQKIPSDVKNISLEYENYISFLINSNRKLIWRRYWAQILNNYLYVYDAEYKNKKEPISRLNLGYVRDIGKTDPEQIYVNNGITVEFQPNYISKETGEELLQHVKTIPLQFIFVNGNEILVEDLENKNEAWSNWNLSAFTEDCRLYCFVDDRKEVVEWIECINKARGVNQ